MLDAIFDFVLLALLIYVIYILKPILEFLPTFIRVLTRASIVQSLRTSKATDAELVHMDLDKNLSVNDLKKLDEYKEMKK